MMAKGVIFLGSAVEPELPLVEIILGRSRSGILDAEHIAGY
jgi:hypothetical protein